MDTKFELLMEIKSFKTSIYNRIVQVLLWINFRLDLIVANYKFCIIYAPYAGFYRWIWGGLIFVNKLQNCKVSKFYRRENPSTQCRLDKVDLNLNPLLEYRYLSVNLCFQSKYRKIQTGTFCFAVFLNGKKSHVHCSHL